MMMYKPVPSSLRGEARKRNVRGERSLPKGRNRVPMKSCSLNYNLYTCRAASFKRKSPSKGKLIYVSPKRNDTSND